MRLAILADIHGNLPALETVLEDCRQQHVEGCIIAGDFVDRPQPLQTIRMLQTLGCWTIRGNREDYLLAYDGGETSELWRSSAQWVGLRWIYDRIDRAALAFLAGLPAERVVAVGGTAPIRVVHGSPGSASALLLPNGDPVAMSLFDKADLLSLSYPKVELDKALTQFREPVLVCGHSHIPWKQELDGRLVLNPGSVGAPINGDVRAQYALLTWQYGRWRAEHRALPYDLDRIRAAYHESGVLAAEGAFARAILLCIETGQNVPGRLVDHFRQLATEAGYRDRNATPDAIWEQAVATFDWEAAVG